MYLPGTKVRIRTVEEIEFSGHRVVGKPYIRFWENVVCEIVAGKRVPRWNKYILKAPNNAYAERGRSDYGLQEVWWYEYELEEYDQFKISDIDECAFSALIEL